MLTILSNKKQYDSFFASFPDRKDVRVLCDNPSFHRFLMEKGIDFEPIGEEDIREKWNEINAWACDRSSSWSSIVGKDLFGGVELAKALYVFFSYYLVAVLKNYLFSELILEKYKPAKAAVFTGERCPDFYKFNGNYFLNVFLKKACDARRVDVELIRLAASSRTEARVAVKEKVRGVMAGAYASVVPLPTGGEVYAASGGLKHLSSILEEMKKRDKKIFLYDPVFKPDRFAYCLKNGIPYLTQGKLLDGNVRRFDYKDGFHKAVEMLRSAGWFRFGDADLSDVVCDELITRTNRYLENLAAWSAVYEKMIKELNLKALIVDEDWTPRGAFMAAFFKSRGIKTFCVSHGYGSLRFVLDGPRDTFYLSKTFVHSEYEKLLYSSKGWDRSHLTVIGVPRYDKLAILKDERLFRDKSRRRMRIMYCGGTILEFAPDWPTYAGGINFEDGRHLKSCIRDVFEILEPLPIELVIRPHNSFEENVWKDFLAKSGTKAKVSLVSAKPDFFMVLPGCDAVILSHWSTAIVESAIFGLPVIVVNYSVVPDGHPYETGGVCFVARNKAELAKTIGDIHSSFLAGKRPECVSAKADLSKKSFFIGLNDGNNTKRVVDSIIGIGE